MPLLLAPLVLPHATSLRTANPPAELSCGRAVSRGVSRLLGLIALTGLIACVAIACSPVAWGQESEPATQVEAPSVANLSQSSAPQQVSEGDVRSALRSLEADNVATRDAAEVELIGMGAGILPLLPEITPRTSGEMKGRLQRIRQALQKENVGAFFEPSKVTLEGELELSKVIQQLQQQSGNAIELQGAEGMAATKIELAAKDEDFWVVMSDVMRQANLRINSYGSTDGSLVLAAGASELEVSPFHTGPFLVQAVSVQSRKFFGSQLDGQLDLSFMLAWEPRLKPVFMQIPMSTLKATTSSGSELPATNPQATLEIPLNLGGCSAQVDLQLQRPERSEAALESLSGELVIAVPGERHQYIFKRFGNGARQSEKYGDVTVTLEGARRNGAVYEIRVLASFADAQGALESFRGWILSNEAYLLDAKDKRTENVGLQTYAITSDSVGIAYLFQINADPDSYRLVYESPAAITKQTIRYELKNIELP